MPSQPAAVTRRGSGRRGRVGTPVPSAGGCSASSRSATAIRRRFWRPRSSLRLGALRRARTQVLILVLALAFPAAASANDFQTVYREYKRTGTIKACKFSDKQLANAQKQTPPDVEQYAPSFLDALQAARERDADCGKKATPAPAPTPTTPAATPPPPSPPPPVPTTPGPAPAPAATPPAPTVPAQATVKGVASPPIANAKKDD